MIKLIVTILSLLFLSLNPNEAFANTNSFVSVVNPIRGSDFWEDEKQNVETAVFGQMEILDKFGMRATWLIRYDALSEQKITEALKRTNHEKGLFLEVIPTWTQKSDVSYHQSNSWHNAESAFLSGYKRDERLRLIDAAFEEFNKIFGFYPKSVGAWWIDAFSLSYMQEKYGVVSALIVADQYTTDNYQIWGQFWSTPYYPAKNNVLHPAQTAANRLPVVITQWAARDPVNAYGNGVEDSTFSVQANDYIDYHELDTNYFSSLVDIYTNQKFNRFGQLTVGLENSYFWEKYQGEYENQMKVLQEKSNQGQFSSVTMEDFALWYKDRFPDLSPPQIIVVDDSLGSFKKAVWFMNPYYRAGWFFNQQGSLIRDVRQYIDGEEELCFLEKCSEINFATSATRVLDEVSFGHRLVIDEGKISDFDVRKSGDNFLISYKNEAGKGRIIELLPRDISIDGKISSIDGIILEATKHQLEKKEKKELEEGSFSWSLFSVVLKTIKFFGFLVIGCLIPGLLLINKILSKETSFIRRANLSLVLGLVLTTLLFYLVSLVNLRPIIFVYLLINLLFLIKFRKQLFHNLYFKIKDKFNFLAIGLIGIGTTFQQLPTFKNGLNFPYGLGFWGPNTHDGVWHISLINQLVKWVPPQNPIFSGEILKNYHYFYDLMVAATNYISGVPILDLLFRFYPITFSLSLGIATYYLIKSITKHSDLESKLAILFGLYLVYFSGSFGWIVEFINVRHLGGESAFWANQSISFNLNPPFAISLIIVLAILQIPFKSKWSIVVLTFLAGSLIAFKAYAGILILLSLFLVGIIRRNFQYLLVFFSSFLLSALLFLSNFSIGKQLIIFSPFWFIHSMIDSPDRVGWARLSLARVAGLEQGNWFKFFAAEIISLAIFVVGNLGTRVFALFSLLKIKRIISDSTSFFLLVFSLLSLFTPILFIQAGNPWNTIQFIYYFLYISAVVGGVVFAKIILGIPKIVALPLFITFVLITPINSWATANGYLSNQPHAFVSKAEFEGLEFLKSQENGIILTYPYDPKIKNRLLEPWPLFVYDSTAYVSALSQKRAFIEDEPQNQILLTDYKKRLVAAKDFFFSSSDQQYGFLEEFKIKYIYIPKIFNKKLDESSNIKNIFENEDVVIYQHK